MPRLRLFANLREVAGTSETDVPGSTVGEVLENASRAYGEDFTRGMERAQVWVNGSPAGAGTEVGDSDEVALIPPVSGGATAVRSAAGMEVALVGVLVVAVAAANFVSAELLAAVLVAVGGLWVWDVVSEARRWGFPVDRWAPMVAVAAGVVLGYVEGLAGLGLAVAATVVVTMVWVVAHPELRDLVGLASTLLVGLLGATGAGSLIVARLAGDGSGRVAGYLAIVVAAGVFGWAATRVVVPYLDPLTAASLGAVLAGTVAGLVWGPSTVTMLLVGVASAMALIAGRASGSLLRTGEIYLVEAVPGSLASLDGPLLAAAVLAPLLAVLA